MVVTLIGYRATGKSSVAKRLASLMQRPCRDSDDEIEARTGQSIAHLFATIGELAFRDQEEAIIDELTRIPNVVLSIGGGAILRAASRQRIRAAGPVIWLRARPETILARMHADCDNQSRRPDLTALPPDEEIRIKLQERTPLYAAMADLTIDTDRLDVSDVAYRVVNYVKPLLTTWQRGEV